MKKVEEIRKRLAQRRIDAEGGWITINGTHVLTDKDGNLTGSVGDKISSSSKGSSNSGNSSKGKGNKISSSDCKKLNELNSNATNGGKGDKAKAREILNKAPVGQKLYCKGERGLRFTIEKTGEKDWTAKYSNGESSVLSTNYVSSWFYWNYTSPNYTVVSDKPFDDGNSKATTPSKSVAVKPRNPNDRSIIGGRKAGPAERTKANVRATGNKWANENWNSTH